jgi:hypothetical protein
VIWKVRPTLQRRFWQAANDSLSESLKKEELDRQWHLEKVLDPFKEPKKDDTGFRCVLRNPASGSPRIHATLSVYRSTISVAVGFTATRPEKVPQEIDLLSRSLQEDKFLLAPRPEDQVHWIAWKDCDVNLDQKELLIDMASDPTLVVYKVVEAFIDLLSKHGLALKAADTALG